MDQPNKSSESGNSGTAEPTESSSDRRTHERLEDDEMERGLVNALGHSSSFSLGINFAIKVGQTQLYLLDISVDST
jgi:hypothetical protein